MKLGNTFRYYLAAADRCVYRWLTPGSSGSNMLGKRCCDRNSYGFTGSRSGFFLVGAADSRITSGSASGPPHSQSP
jgi:hypothetical protein